MEPSYYQHSALTSPCNGAKIVGPKFDPTADGPGPSLMLAETLTGNEVVNAANEKLGDIKGIMLDVERGKIGYAVLSAGGFLGIGERLFAIPWEALMLDTYNKQFILRIDKAKLKNAPSFDKSNWPSMADIKWASDVHSFYGVRHYWD
ncbi:PRC-barrel domain-containing protein [Chitinimonas sp. BJB300]|uniref:PRC-barrel domain-containing protein n=1 Tax=Chitinimonas sp. BJB300 TaxID=1559339 RepID=UPI000C0F5009|nr:PRC-barrel domain-containing protein [Chitinimonas sp. BJB300]PHV09770.1 photosystem reaction center subunit H [Chitinimonas sp. BJB300]TSJ90147.1 PRC-barrel domain containing protein [Chitinimonas sp. BJB300]